MSFKAFLRLFIALSVLMDGLSQNQTNCVNFIKDEKFPFEFLPERLARDQSVWENVVRKIKNFTNRCLLNKTKSGCRKPVVNITFLLISKEPKIQLQVLPRPFLAAKEASSGTTSQVLCALGNSWKLFLFCVMAAVISGVMIWFLDHKANAGHFPKSFWSGTREGLWWAIVTMTTVGYGDKTPKSFLGRVYASLWMIIGMLLMSSFTAEISSTITTDGLRPLDDKFGYSVGIPQGSKEFFNKFCKGSMLKEYFTEDDLFQGLFDGNVDKILLFDCKENGEKREFKIVNFPYNVPVIGAGVELERCRRKEKKYFNECLKEWARRDELHQDKGEQCYSEQVASTILKEEVVDCIKPEQLIQPRCIENHSGGKYRDANRTTPPSMGPTDILLCITAGLLITLLTIGALWDSCLKIRHAKKSQGNNVDIEKAVGVQELQSAVAILKREESATGFPSSVIQGP